MTAATAYFQLAQEAVPSDSDLKKKSQWVISIPQKFAELRKAVPIDLECYYEGSNVKVGDSDVKIVDKSLAQCPEGSPAERLACNHERMSRFESESDKDFAKILRVLKKWVAKIPPPEKEGTVNYISNASFAGSTNSGMQLGQNAGNITGFSFGK